MEYGLTFDDVLLRPKMGVLSSRKDADLSTELIKGRPLQIPIVSANMASITGRRMCSAMNRLGGVGFIHRNQEYGDSFFDWKFGSRTGVITIGLDDWKALDCYAGGWRDHWPLLYCLDVAHGDHDRVYKFIYDVWDKYPDIKLIVGNIATHEAAARMIQFSHVVAVKVGIGPGAACTTRETTGFGVPQLTAIMEVARAIKDSKSDVKLIADGGIRNSGDIAKAIGAGADTVMIGRLFAGADEVKTPGHYAGSASLHVREAYRAPEGVSNEVPRTGPVEDTVKSLLWGLRSAISYSGYRSLQEFKGNGDFLRVTSNSLSESNSRI